MDFSKVLTLQKCDSEVSLRCKAGGISNCLQETSHQSREAILVFFFLINKNSASRIWQGCGGGLRTKQ